MGSISLSVIDTKEIFDPSRSRYSDKYRDVLRRVMYAQCKVRITIVTCYLGKIKTSVTTRCEKRKQMYKLRGRTGDLRAKIATTYSIKSDKQVSCNCAKLMEEPK